VQTRTAILAGRVAAYGLTAAAIAILANTAVSNCQARDERTGPAGSAGPAAASAPAQSPTGRPGGPPAASPPGAPRRSAAAAVPSAPAAPGQLRMLAGRWLSGAQAKDYFIFKADGRGAWLVRGRALWQGRATSAGRYTFRLSWPTTGGQRTAYWQVRLLEGGRRLVFSGTRQTYRKV
jgi:hypothetical protein